MSLFKSVATFGGFTMLSRITGFCRDMILANFLGAGVASDAFFVAFKLPNLFRSLFAEGAFTTAFVPMLSQKLVDGDKKQAVVFAAKAISVLAVFVGCFVLVVELLMPWVIAVLAPGFVDDAGKIELATELSRITFPFLLFISIVSFQSGILNSFNKFAAPAAAPVILNLMMIASVLVFVPFSSSAAHGIAFGVTVAGFVEILWLMYFLHRQGVYIRPQTDIVKILKDAEIRTLFKRIAPGVLGAGIYQINMVVDTILVSLVGTGAISWLYYANRLQQLPLGVVGAAISVAVLPILSRCIKMGEKEQAKEVQAKAFEYGALLSFPAAAALVVLAEPMINILFQHGKFGYEETVMTAKALVVYALGLPAYVLVKSLAPNFFARGDTRTPVKYSMVVLITNLVFAVLLMKPLGHVGIACATTIAAFVSLAQYLHGLRKRDFWVCSKNLTMRVLKIAGCAVFMGGLLFVAQVWVNSQFGNWLEWCFWKKLLMFGFLCVLGFISFVFCAMLSKVLDVKDVLQKLRNRGKADA